MPNPYLYAVIGLVVVIVVVGAILGMQVSSLNARVTSLENQYNTLMSNYTALQSRYNQLQQQYAGLQGRLSALNSTYSSVLAGLYRASSSDYVEPGNYDTLVAFYVPHGCTATVAFIVTSSTSPVNVYVTNFTSFADWTMAYVAIHYFAPLFPRLADLMYGLLYNYTNVLYQYGFINYSAYEELTYTLNTTVKPELQQHMEQYESEFTTNYTQYASLSGLSIYYWPSEYSLTQTITITNNAANMTVIGSVYVVVVKNVGSQGTYVSARITSYELTCNG